MIKDFSDGYYWAEMDVQEYSDGPVIQDEVYKFINRTIYLGSHAPVTMRIGLDAGEHFTVEAESAVPREVLAAPEHLIDEGDDSEVFLMKPNLASTIGKHYG